MSDLRIWRPERGEDYAVFPDDEFARLSSTHAFVVLAGALGHDVSENDREVYCRHCDWRRPAEPNPPSWRTADEHLLDVTIPALVDAGDLQAADVPAFRRLAVQFPGTLSELLAAAH